MVIGSIFPVASKLDHVAHLMEKIHLHGGSQGKPQGVTKMCITDFKIKASSFQVLIVLHLLIICLPTCV